MLRISHDKIPTAAQILAQAFFEDPMLSFIFPNVESRRDALTAFFKVFLADSVKRGEVIIAPEDKGVIAWYPSDVQVFDDQFQEVLAQLAEVCTNFNGLEAGERLEQIGSKIEACEPTTARCEVLWIGLLPEARGKGMGSELLSPVFNYADQEKVGCYLVSSTPRNISFYERQGFRQVCPIPINDEVLLTGMWRDFVEK
jgi:ribosomal protein S18 acetylase RimI-like enzyme